MFIRSATCVILIDNIPSSYVLLMSLEAEMANGFPVWPAVVIPC